MTYISAIFILLCGLFEVYLCQPETTKEAELKKLGNYHAKLKSFFTREDELIRIADELVRLDECKEAIAFFTKAIKSSPSKSVYYRDRGNCYSKLGKWSEAYSDKKKERSLQYRSPGKRSDEDPSKLRWLCSDLASQNLNNEAILCFTDAIKMEPLEYVFYKQRADCYKILKNYVSAELDCREVLKNNPKDKESRISLIRVLFLDGKSEDAVAEMRFLNDIELVELGDDFCDREGKFKEGIQCYTEASKQSHLDPEYYLKRGICYEKMGELDEAVNDYKSAFEKKPNDNIVILEKLIPALFKTKRIEEATREIETLSYDDLKRLGTRLFYSDEFEYAILIFTKAIERNSDDATNYNFRGYCYSRMGNLDLALSDYEEAVKLDPSDKLYLSNQLTVFFKIGRFKEAVEKLSMLGESELRAMGNALLKDGKPTEALECFTEAIRKDQRSSYNYEKAGECHWMKGDFGLAKFETEKAIELLPLMTASRRDLQIKWCEKLVEGGMFAEARLALKKFENECKSYGVPVEACLRIPEIRDKMTEMERNMKTSPSAE